MARIDCRCGGCGGCDGCGSWTLALYIFIQNGRVRNLGCNPNSSHLATQSSNQLKCSCMRRVGWCTDAENGHVDGTIDWQCQFLLQQKRVSCFSIIVSNHHVENWHGKISEHCRLLQQSLSSIFQSITATY
jgi:hypothetical protein